MTAFVNKHWHSRTQNCNTALSKTIIWHQPRPATKLLNGLRPIL